jgi:sarcosine oxidase subunit gamma
VTADHSLRRSPLHHRAADLAAASHPGLTLTELPFLTMVTVRVDPRGGAAARIADRLGVALPTAAGTAGTAGDRAALWVGPDEWLVVGPDGDTLPALLGEALGGERGAVVDVSANRTTVEIGGRHARDVLEQGCALDLHPRAFAAGRCASTLLARTQVVLWQTSDAPAYRLVIRGSFAAYLADWLLDAAPEYGPVRAP